MDSSGIPDIPLSALSPSNPLPANLPDNVRDALRIVRGEEGALGVGPLADAARAFFQRLVQEALHRCPAGTGPNIAGVLQEEFI